MPLYHHHHINKDVQLAIWDIAESSSWFESQLNLHEQDKVKYVKIANEARKQQWLATRLLLKTLSGNDELHITNNSERKPCLNSQNLDISITHTLVINSSGCFPGQGEVN